MQARKKGVDTPELAAEMTERKSELERSGRLPELQSRALRSAMQQGFHSQNSPRQSGGEDYDERMGSRSGRGGSRDEDDRGSGRGHGGFGLPEQAVKPVDRGSGDQS